MERLARTAPVLAVAGNHDDPDLLDPSGAAPRRVRDPRRRAGAPGRRRGRHRADRLRAPARGPAALARARPHVARRGRQRRRTRGCATPTGSRRS